MIELDIITVSMIVGTVIPLLVALITKSQAPSSVKAWANVVLSAIAGGGAFLVANSGKARWQEIVIAALSTYTVSGVSYGSFWKPTGAAPAVADIAPNAGLGTVSYGGKKAA